MSFVWIRRLSAGVIVVTALGCLAPAVRAQSVTDPTGKLAIGADGGTACGNDVGVNVGGGDACGAEVALATTGTASGYVAVSGTGVANDYPVFGPCNGAVSVSGEQGSCAQVMAASGTNTALGGDVAVSGLRAADGREFVISGAGPASESCSADVAVSVMGNACGRSVGASGIGQGYGNTAGASGTGHSCGYVGVSGTGDACGGDYAVSGAGNAASYGIAVSGTQNADSYGAQPGVGVAASGLGRAFGPTAGASGTGPACGYVGVSAVGDACGGDYAASGAGSAAAYTVAVSGTGDATAYNPTSAAATGNGTSSSAATNEIAAARNALLATLSAAGVILPYQQVDPAGSEVRIDDETAEEPPAGTGASAGSGGQVGPLYYSVPDSHISCYKPSDTYSVRDYYFNQYSGQFLGMRMGYHCAHGGFGFRHIMARRDRAADFSKYEDTLRWGYPFPTNDNDTSEWVYWCEDDWQYQVLVSFRPSPYGDPKGVITAYKTRIS